MAGLSIAIDLNEQLHAPPYGHPENAARLRGVAAELETLLASGRGTRLLCQDHGLDPVTRIHDEAYVSGLKEICKRGPGYLDADTYVTSGSFNAAVSVVNAVLSGIDSTFNGEDRRVFVLGRPPGHHAERNHAMGFCLVNNVAIAAQYALDHCGAKRVAIVDFDVHHGNGIQHAFYDRKDVLYISSHRFPFYPGTGSADDIGVGEGEGFTVNLPLPAGTGDDEIVSRYETEVAPALERFRPDVLLVSAGFDACYRDPLGGMKVTGAGYLQIGRLLRQTADRVCGGRVVSALEGGYDEQGNTESIMQYLNGIGYD